MNRDVTISGGVAASGTISILKEDQQTEMTTIQIPEFQGTTHSNTTYFWVKNTGNLPVAVYWLISNCHPDSWAIESGGQAYRYMESAETKFRFSINNQINPDGTTGSGLWNPDPNGNQVVLLNPGQDAKFAIDVLHYYQDVNTPGTFSFTLSFYARQPET